MCFKNLFRCVASQLEISSTGDSRSKAMEGLRGIAVFLVFLVHYSSLVEPWVPEGSLSWASMQFLERAGHSGVDLFFLLSGFLIYGSIIRVKSFDVFAYSGRRLVRIYPTFLVMLATYLLLSWAFPNESKLPDGAFEAVIYVMQNALLLPGIMDIEPIITVAWSLSYEMFFYAAVPLVVLTLRMKNWTPGQRIAFWLSLALLGLMRMDLLQGHVRLLMFVSGIVLYEVIRSYQLRIGARYTCIILLIVAVCGLRGELALSKTWLYGFLFVAMFVLCLSALSPKNGEAKWLAARPVRWLGNMSYSYYLIHGLALKFAFMLLPLVLPKGDPQLATYYLLMIPMFAFTLPVAFVLFTLVERPFSIDQSAGQHLSELLRKRSRAKPNEAS